MNKLLILLVAVFSVACSAPKATLVERIPFPVAEYESLPKTGTSVISGKAFIKISDEEIHYPDSRESIRLNPKTSYSKQWYDVNYVVKDNIGEPDKRYYDYIHTTKADTEGNFKFENVPAGTYYLSAPILWIKEVKNPDGSIMYYNVGDFICYEVTVKNNDVLVSNIVVNKKQN